MSFANPLGLLALLSLPAIVYLHLIRERRRKVEISDLRPWAFLEEELRGSVPLRVPFTWLLLVDLLIALFVSLAIARPQLNVPVAAPGARNVVLLMDTSLSMRAADVPPSRIEAAKRRALSLLAGMGPRDVATVVGFGGGVQVIGDTRQESLQDLLAEISALEAGGVGSYLPEAHAVAQSFAVPDLPLELHLLSDGAFPRPDVPLQDFVWHGLDGSGANQAVLAVEARKVAPSRVQVFARVANYSASEASRLISLYADGEPIDSSQVRPAARSTLGQIWEVSGVPGEIEVEIVGQDALDEDDHAWLALPAAAPVEVGLVAADPGPLERALRAVPGVTVRALQPDEYEPGMGFDLTVFRGALPEEWPEGHVIVFDPSGGSGLLQVGERRAVSGLASAEKIPLLAGLDFNGVRWGEAWQLSTVPEELQVVLGLEGAPLILQGGVGPSSVVVVLPALETGNFTGHPSFPGLIANAVEGSRSLALPTRLSPGEPIPLPSSAAYPGLELQLPDGDTADLSTNRPAVWEETLRPGLYRLALTDRDGRTLQHTLAVNGGAGEESNLAAGDWVSELPTGIVRSGAAGSRPLDLRPLLILAAVLLLFVEARIAWR